VPPTLLSYLRGSSVLIRLYDHPPLHPELAMGDGEERVLAGRSVDEGDLEVHSRLDQQWTVEQVVLRQELSPTGRRGSRVENDGLRLVSGLDEADHVARPDADVRGIESVPITPRNQSYEVKTSRTRYGSEQCVRSGTVRSRILHSRRSYSVTSCQQADRNAEHPQPASSDLIWHG
jgi:hypothetical protein